MKIWFDWRDYAAARRLVLETVVRLDAGAIYLNGTPVHNLPLYRRARMGIARTWQNMRLFHTMSLLENLLIGARDYPGESVLTVLFQPGQLRAEEERQKEKALAILTRVGLATSADKRVADLPFGQQLAKFRKPSPFFGQSLGQVVHRPTGNRAIRQLVTVLHTQRAFGELG